MIRSGLYLRARPEATNYLLTSTMSRENWCLGCFQLARYRPGTTYHKRAGAGAMKWAEVNLAWVELKNPVCSRRLD